MYCKNCGKRLPDNARFCDRCNMSVRKKDGKLDRIAELKEERLARRKAQAIEERHKKIKKIKSERRKRFGMIVIGVLLLGVISGAAAYIVYMNGARTDEIEEAPVITDSPKPTESATAVVVGEGIETAAPSVNVPNRDGYIECSLSGRDFCYPVMFVEADKEADELYSLADSSSSGKIRAGITRTDKTAKTLMKEHARNVTDSRATENSYYLNELNGSHVYHRAGYIADGTEYYYELTYLASDGKKQEYDAYIEYMDAYFRD